MEIIQMRPETDCHRQLSTTAEGSASLIEDPREAGKKHLQHCYHHVGLFELEEVLSVW